MAGIMNSVLPAIGTGIQPKDNPNPAAPPTSASGPTFASLMGSAPPAANPATMQAQSAADAPGGAQPSFGQVMGGAQPQQQPQNPSAPPPDSSGLKDDQHVDEIFAALQGKEGEKREIASQQDHFSEAEDLINQIGAGADPNAVDNTAPIIDKKDGESNWSAAVRNLPQTMQFAAAQMRAKLGRNPKEQLSAFQSMYGDKNVKTVGNTVYFRPEDSKKFRKVDQPLFNSMVDFVLFNALNAVPTAANVAAQGVTEGAMAAGSAGLAAVPGVAVAGAVGGATDSVVRQGMISALDALSARKQSDENLDLSKQVMWDAGLNAVAGPVVRGAMNYVPPVVNAVGKIAQNIPGMKGLVSAGQDALQGAGEQIQKLANVRVAFKEMKDQLFPDLGDNHQVGQAIGSAIDKTEDILGKQVGVIKQKALSLAESTGAKSPMTNTKKQIQDILSQFGYTFNQMGTAIAPGEREFLLKDASLQNALGTLQKFQNNLASDALVLGGTSGKGTELSSLLNHIDDFSRLAKYDAKSTTDSQIRSLYSRVRNAAASDRNEMMNELFSSSSEIEGKSWANAYSKYSQNIDAIGQFKTMFHTPQEREFLVSAISKAPTAERMEMLDGMKKVLGPDSREYSGLRGQLLENVINERTQEGVINAPEVFKFLTSPKNAPLVNRMLEPDEKKLVLKMVKESSHIATGGVMTNSTKQIVEDGALKMIEMATEPRTAVKRLFSMFGSNKKAIDYLTDEGFLAAAGKASSPEIRQNILKAMAYSDSLRSKMTIVNVPTKTAKGAKQMVEKYAPLGRAFSGLASDAMERQVQSGGQAMPQVGPQANATPAASPEMDANQLLQQFSQ